MPASKNALLRYKTIDRCLRNRTRRWTIEDLVEKCNEAMWEYNNQGVSLRTVQLDLQFMRSMSPGYDAPIIVVEKKYYTYEDPNYSILKAQVSEDDVQKVKEAVGILRQMSGFQLMTGMEDVVGRLEDHVASIGEKKKPVIYFERNDQTQGLQYIPIIYDAIQRKQVLKIRYKSFRALRENDYLFSPYVLKEFRNRWFVFGRHTRAKMLTNFALDRIVSIEVATPEEQKFIEDLTFDPETYFENIVGVTKTNEPALEIRFWASAEEAPYIETKPIHKSQEVVERRMDGSMVFSLQCQINYELIRDLMGYAEGLQVLYPRRLVSLMRRKYEQGAELYRER